VLLGGEVEAGRFTVLPERFDEHMCFSVLATLRDIIAYTCTYIIKSEVNPVLVDIWIDAIADEINSSTDDGI
jgi:hypothetical protein